MNSAIERLLTLRATDVMSKQVVRVWAHQAMSEAATIMLRQGISGAPVVNAEGQCVGVLSATDFVRYQKEPGKDGLVRSHMSADVHSVPPDATLMDVARAMCGRHIHRLVVLDDHRHVVGVVTSLDLVAAMVNAVGE
jgi:IMP dehydrogenase